MSIKITSISVAAADRGSTPGQDSEWSISLPPRATAPPFRCLQAVKEWSTCALCRNHRQDRLTEFKRPYQLAIKNDLLVLLVIQIGKGEDDARKLLELVRVFDEIAD